MNYLFTAAELAPMFRVHEKTIRRWKISGKINAEIDHGHTLLFDAEKVRKQLAKISRKPAKPASSKGEIMVPTL